MLVVRSPRLGVTAAVVLLASAACLPGDFGSPPGPKRSAGATGIAYAEEAACAERHRAEHRAWTGSHHDLAMQPATVETVLGDFGDAVFSRFGVTSRFFTRDGRFFVNTEGADGRLADFKMMYTFGADPLQQYLAPFPGGRLQSLTIAWDTVRGEWFHLCPDERIRPGDPLHWTGRRQNWNAMCAERHSTNVRKNHDLAGDAYRTVWDARSTSVARHAMGRARRTSNGRAADRPARRTHSPAWSSISPAAARRPRFRRAPAAIRTGGVNLFEVRWLRHRIALTRRRLG